MTDAAIVEELVKVIHSCRLVHRSHSAIINVLLWSGLYLHIVSLCLGATPDCSRARKTFEVPVVVHGDLRRRHLGRDRGIDSCSVHYGRGLHRVFVDYLRLVLRSRLANTALL